MVKEKPHSIRTYDDDGYRRRAACLCFKDDSFKEVLLVSSSNDSELYVVPGGGVEPQEDERLAAVRELLEEAGVRGVVKKNLGVFQNEVKKTRTAVYVLVVTETFDDWEDAKIMGRKRKWFLFKDAALHLSAHKPVQKDYLELACNNHSNGHVQIT